MSRAVFGGEKWVRKMLRERRKKKKRKKKQGKGKGKEENTPTRPIVQKNETKDMILNLVDVDGIPQLVARTNEAADLELKVQETARTKVGALRWIRTIGLELSSRRSNWCAGHNNRGGSSVIANGKSEPVGLERVVGTTEHGANVGGVLARRVEVREVANSAGERHDDG